MGIFNGGVEKEFYPQEQNLLLGFKARYQVERNKWWESQTIVSQRLVGGVLGKFVVVFWVTIALWKINHALHCHLNGGGRWKAF
jgi:hypothetical protein